MKIIVDKIADNKIDSFWYHGEIIAEIELPDGHKLIAETRGTIEMRFEENGTKFVGDNAVTEALNLNWTDVELYELFSEDLCFFSNWFVVIEIDAEGELISDDLGVVDDYNEAIKMLQEIYDDLKD